MSILKSRHIIIKRIIIFFIIILIIDLFIIQIIKSEYKFSAKNNSVRYESESTNRGKILDRNNNLLITNKPKKDLIIIPRETKDTDKKKLAEILNISIREFDSIYNIASNYSNYKESVFIKELDIKTASKIEESLSEFNGFYTRDNYIRDYRYDLGAHVLGYLSPITKNIEEYRFFTNGDLKGVTGIEAAYDKQLRGHKGMKMILVDVNNEKKGSFKNGEFDIKSESGHEITCTIDIELQKQGEKMMANKKGAIVAIDPTSGEILCLISYPTYSLNKMQGQKRSSYYLSLVSDTINRPLINRALAEYYAPASNFKIVNSLIALQEGVISHVESINCEGQFNYGNNKRLQCHKDHSSTNISKAIEVSCNVYFCKIWEKLFKKRNKIQAYNNWKNHVSSFGFGSLLGNDFIIGKKGIIPLIKDLDAGYHRWNCYTLIGMAIGQGKVSVTPIQMANLAAILANKGYYITPHIIKKIYDPIKDENIEISKEFKTKKYTSIDKEHYENVMTGMRLVLDSENGTAYSSKKKDLVIYGKTGTSEKTINKKKVPEHSSFIGFSKKGEKNIAIYVIVEDGGYGKDFAAPIATLMIEKYLNESISDSVLEEKITNKSPILQ